MDVSNSQNSTLSSMSHQQLRRLTADVVTYLLVANQKKYAIKRVDIIKHVIKEYAKCYARVLDGARVKLQKVFGIRLVELPDKKGQYMLINDIETNPEHSHLSWSKPENAQMGLLATVLAIIFMNDNSIADGELWHALKKLDVTAECHHPEFGDVHKLLSKDFVRQLYLEYRSVPNSDPVVHEFMWGPRAHEEVSKMELLDFVCQIYGDGVQPDQWNSQYKEATKGAER